MILFRPCQYVVAFFAAVSISSSAAYENGTVFSPKSVHKRMTAEEVQQVFQTTHDSVPDYEVVQVHISRLVKRGSRSSRELRLIPFDTSTRLLRIWLQPTEGTLARKDTPVKIIKKDSKGRISFKNYANAMNNVGTLLEDPTTRATVVVGTNRRGRRSVNGYVLSKKLVIRSLPETISEDLLKDRLTENPDSLNHSKITRSAYHVVFKREIKHAVKRHKSFEINESRIRQSRAPTTTTAAPRRDIAYPEIMVVVDPTLLAINNNDIDKTLAYVVAFWNGVDLLYRNFQSPKFRFNIARVIIAQEQNVLPYMPTNLDKTKPNIDTMVDGSVPFFYSVLNVLPSDSYDAVVTMTRLDMVGDDNSVTLGLSVYKGMCAVSHTARGVQKVAVIQDYGSFDGVFTAAHEIGHMLGADHDGEDNECLSTDGYIMTDASYITQHSHDFSSCSVRSMGEFLNTRGLCLYNVPNSANPLPRVLPGKLKDRDHQCQSFGYGKNCYTTKKLHQCTAIYCETLKKPIKCTQYTEYAPADGAFCGLGKVCIHGKCLQLPAGGSNRGR